MSRFPVLGISGWPLLLFCLACGSSTEPANEPTGISIIHGNATSLAVNVGGEVSLLVVVKNSSGAVIETPGTISFASRNSSIATVDGGGKVTALHAGVTYVVASLASGTRVLLDSVQIDVFALVGSAHQAARQLEKSPDYWRVNRPACDVQVPEHWALNYFGNGWDCERGYYRANGNCTEVQVPEQATLNYYGNGWKCMRGYRRSISACVPVGVPEAGDAELESAR